MKRNYHTIDNPGKVGERKLTEFLVRNGQALLPMMELIEHSRMAIDEPIEVIELSAAQIAGPVLRQKCVRRHVVMQQRVHNGDADPRVVGSR